MGIFVLTGTVSLRPFFHCVTKHRKWISKRKPVNHVEKDTRSLIMEWKWFCLKDTCRTKSRLSTQAMSFVICICFSQGWLWFLSLSERKRYWLLNYLGARHFLYITSFNHGKYYYLLSIFIKEKKKLRFIKVRKLGQNYKVAECLNSSS